jgi:hypothetical protein
MSFVSKAIGKVFGTDDAADKYAEASRAAAAKAEFSPYNVTTGFGTSEFDKKEKTATYTLDPRLASFRDILYAAGEAAIPDPSQVQFAEDVGAYGQGLFAQAAGLDIDQMTRDYYNKQINLLQPQRTAQDIQLSEDLFKSGRSGLGVSLGGGGYVNPEQYSLLKAREEANLGLMLGAEDRARGIQTADIQRALGYYGLGQELRTTPYQTASGLFGLGSNIEQLGLVPLQYGIDIGSQSAAAGANAANILMQGAGAQYQSSLANAGIFSNLIGSAFNGLGGWSGISGGMSNMFGGGGGYQPGFSTRANAPYPVFR